MNQSSEPGRSSATSPWYALPSLEEAWLMAIHYRRVLLGFIVAFLVLFVETRFNEMNRRLFQPSLQGVHALLHYELGRFSHAARAYRTHLHDGGWKEWINGDESYAALLRGDLPEAGRLARIRLTQVPDDIEALLTEGEVALAEGNLQRASGIFEQGVAQDVHHFDALLLSAVAYSRSGNMEAAIDRFRRALRHNDAGRRITAYLWALETAGDLRPHASEGTVWCLLAHYYRYLRIFDPANARLVRHAANQTLRLGTHLDDAYISLGILEEKTGNFAAALPYFLKAMEVNPRNAEAYRWAANMYRHRGSDLLNEYEMWKGAYQAAPADEVYRDSLIDFLTERFGDYPQALDLAVQALHDQPHSKELLLRVASLQQRMGRHQEAIGVYRDLVSLQPSDTRALIGIGFSLVSLEQYDEAIATYRQALAIHSDDPTAYSGLGSVYGRQGRYADSIREYETALLVGGDDLNIRSFLCTQYWAANRYRDAEACLKHVLRYDPYNKSAMQIYPYVMKGLEFAAHDR